MLFPLFEDVTIAYGYILSLLKLDFGLGYSPPCNSRASSLSVIPSLIGAFKILPLLNST